MTTKAFNKRWVQAGGTIEVQAGGTIEVMGLGTMGPRTYSMDGAELARFLSQDPGVERVREFHEAFGRAHQPEPWMPELGDEDRRIIRDFALQLSAVSWQLKHAAEVANMRQRPDLGLLLVRLQMHVEEGGELAEAWVEGSLVKVLDALTDISYVTDGTYLTHGLAAVKIAADEEVHRSNMSKLDLEGKPIIALSGRVVKPPHYSPPDLASLLE